MKTYLIRRFLLMIPTLLGISIITFAICSALPGGPVEQAMLSLRYGSQGGEAATGSSGTARLDEEYLHSLREYYGFDKPPVERYFVWMGKILRLNFGQSYYFEEPVLDVIIRHLPVSITFGVTSLLLTYFFCVPLGIAKAVWHGTKFDYATSFFIFLGYSIPGFALLILLIVLFGGGTWLDLFPIQGFTSANFDDLSLLGKFIDILHHMALPLMAYSVTLLAFNTMLMKNSLMDQITADYVRTAFAKGLNSRKVILKHAVRNALIPIATGLGTFLTFFLAGSLLIETIAGLDGMSKLFFDSMLNRDYPVVLAIIMISSVAAVLGTLLSDLAYTLVDPRIDFS